MDRGDVFRLSAYHIAKEGNIQRALEYMTQAHKDYSDAIELSPNTSELYGETSAIIF